MERYWLTTWSEVSRGGSEFRYNEVREQHPADALILRLRLKKEERAAGRGASSIGLLFAMPISAEQFAKLNELLEE